MEQGLTNGPDLVTKIQFRERMAYELLYQFVYPSIAHYVQKNSGSQADAEDIFQETLLVMVEKVNQPGFELTSSFKTYLFAIARNLWLKRLRQQRLHLVNDMTPYESLPEPTADESGEERVSGWLAKVTPMCRLLLRALFYENKPIEQFMRHMGWKNKHTADNQKYKCVQQIRKVATT